MIINLLQQLPLKNKNLNYWHLSFRSWTDYCWNVSILPLADTCWYKNF